MIFPFKKGVMHLCSDRLDASYLIGSKCPHCGAAAFPARVICHNCRQGPLEEVPLGKSGKLASYTVAWAAPEGFKPPLALGYIDLSEGIRLLSMLTGFDPCSEVLELGQQMELLFERVRTDDAGNQIVAFKFRPTPKGGDS